MTDQTIGELEAKIRAAVSASDGQQQELLQLLAKLKTEIGEREQQNLGPLKHSVDELRAAVDGFEQSHPRLVQIANNISNSLANWGI